MAWWNTIFAMFVHSETINGCDTAPVVVNPANGLPMINGIGSMDVQGNPYGTDFQQNLEQGIGCFDFSQHDSFNNFGGGCFGDD